jgi:glutamate/tyrosine decarboxylase-like PLP-dependent enzyme
MPVTVAAQYLAAGWDQNCFSFISSPVVACIESAALRWIKEALGLPASAEGALVTGATMANFTCLAAARNSNSPRSVALCNGASHRLYSSRKRELRSLRFGQ